MSYRGNPINPFPDLDLQGQLLIVCSILYMAEIIIKMFSGLLASNLLTIILEILLIVAVALSSPLSDDGKKIHFYYCTVVLILLNLIITPFSIYGRVVQYLFNIVLWLVVLDDVINAMLYQRPSDLSISVILAIASGLFFIESISHILSTNIIGIASLMAVISAIFASLVIFLHLGNQKFIATLYAVLMVILNVGLGSGISGYGLGVVVFFTYSIISLIKIYTKKS